MGADASGALPSRRRLPANLRPASPARSMPQCSRLSGAGPCLAGIEDETLARLPWYATA